MFPQSGIPACRVAQTQAAKVFVPVKTIAAIHPFRLGCGQQHWNVVAGFGVAGGEYFSGCAFSEHPVQRVIARTA